MLRALRVLPRRALWSLSAVEARGGWPSAALLVDEVLPEQPSVSTVSFLGSFGVVPTGFGQRFLRLMCSGMAEVA